VPNTTAVLFRLMHRIHPAESLVAIVLIVGGVIGGLRAESWIAAALWWAPAVVVLLVARVAKARQYVVFEADREGAVGFPSVMPDVCRGVAAGTFYNGHGFAYELSHVAVQIRWHGKVRPPELVVLTPAELPVRGFNETEASYLVRWYPGVEVTRGTLHMGAYTFPGVRLRFVGRVLYLGLESEQDAAAIVTAMVADGSQLSLQSGRHGS
jgi:hypothetical protein